MVVASEDLLHIDSPESRSVWLPRFGKAVQFPAVAGLVHHKSRVAACLFCDCIFGKSGGAQGSLCSVYFVTDWNWLQAVRFAQRRAAREAGRLGSRRWLRSPQDPQCRLTFQRGIGTERKGKRHATNHRSSRREPGKSQQAAGTRRRWPTPQAVHGRQDLARCLSSRWRNANRSN